jgi:upstream activation factor subunit UAF30
MAPKTTKQTVTETTPAPAPSAVPVVKTESSPPKVEKSKKASSKKAEVPAQEQPVETQTITTTVSASETPAPVAPVESVDQLSEMEAFVLAELKQIQELETTITNLLTTLKSKSKSLEKKIASQTKMVKKELDKAKRKKKSGQNSGFKKPVRVVPSFAKMLNISPEETHPRGEVVKMLHAYIKSHKLQNPSNRKEIIPDESLLRLFEPKFSDEIRNGTAQFTYFNFQKHIKHLFIKTEATA